MQLTYTMQGSYKYMCEQKYNNVTMATPADSRAIQDHGTASSNNGAARSDDPMCLTIKQEIEEAPCEPIDFRINGIPVDQIAFIDTGKKHNMVNDKILTKMEDKVPHIEISHRVLNKKTNTENDKDPKTDKISKHISLKIDAEEQAMMSEILVDTFPESESSKSDFIHESIENDDAMFDNPSEDGTQVEAELNLLTPSMDEHDQGIRESEEALFMMGHFKGDGQFKPLVNSPDTPKKKKYICKTCGKGFAQHSHRRSHMNIHTGEKPYVCKECGRAFSQSSHLRTHMFLHTGAKPYTCEICNKGFRASSEITRHMRLHTGEKPFSCKFCDKLFTQSSHLTTHMRLHTGERPLSCTICGRGFTTSSNLNVHMRLHTVERPYNCNICCRKFSQSCNLKRHMTLHTAPKPGQFESASNIPLETCTPDSVMDLMDN